MSTGSLGRVTETEVRGQRGRLRARLVDLDRDVTGQQDADPGHRAEERPGSDDPVAVLDYLQPQPFRSDQHVHGARAFFPGFTPWSLTGTLLPSAVTIPPPCSSPGIRFMTPTKLGDKRRGRLLVQLVRRGDLLQLAVAHDPDAVHVNHHGDRDDDDHAQAERLADILLPGDDVAVQERADLDRGQRDGPVGQRLGGGVGGQGAAEQQQHAAQERGQQHRAAHEAPVIPGPRVQVLGGLPPGRP